MSFLFEGLNPEQLNVVKSVEGPVLVLAGAGSGKTKALTHRLAYIIEQQLAQPDQILAVTFTNKAATEMKHRVDILLSESEIAKHFFSPSWLSTFHSFGAKILRLHASALGYQTEFTIFDDSDQISMIKKLLKDLNLDAQIEAKDAQKMINQIKSKKQIYFDKKPFGQKSQMIETIYLKYEKQMKANQAMDFSDLLFKTYQLFKNNKEILNFYQEQFKYILVDEYQDTNELQYELIRLLSMGHKNLCVVGDEDQSIYSWRGADISNILNFENDFQGASVFRLEQNYRSTQNIINAASEVIKNNQNRKGKELFTRNQEGELIDFIMEASDYEEAKAVARIVAQLVSQGDVSPKEIAILYRTNAQSRLLEEQLRLNSIPYRIFGGLKFYDRAEVKDVLSYMRLIYNPKDDVALRRIINVPARGIGKTSLDKIMMIASQNGFSLWETLYFVVEDKLLPAGTLSKIKDFLALLESLSAALSNRTLLEFYVFLLEQSGYLQSLKQDISAESQARIDNLEAFSNAIEQYMKESTEPTLSLFLEEMALVSDLDKMEQGQNTVTLMTVHMSKGLEFAYVFVVGLEEGLFPQARGGFMDPDDLEEERRLFYVAMTRAKKKLYLMAAQVRRVWGQEQMNPVARFISEVPKKCMVTNINRIGQRQSGFANRYRTQSANINKDVFESQSFYDETSSSLGASTGSSLNSWSQGGHVKHPHFGKGVIRQVEGDGEETRLTILFEGTLMKKFIAKYAKLERLS